MNAASIDIKSVKVSQPQISKTNSLRSASASDEYFSDYASDASSKSNLTRAKYETPPSKISTPIMQQQPLESEMTLPPRPPAARPAPLNVRASQFENGRSRGQDGPRDFISMSPPTPGVDETPYIRFAIEQLTRDEELLGRGRQGSVVSTDYPVQRVIPDEGLGYTGPPAPPSQPPQQPGQAPSRPGTLTQRPPRGAVLLPVAPPNGSQWEDLGFLPAVLRLPLLLALIVSCLLIITGLIFSNVYASRHHGLFEYDGTGTARYFVFQFLPQLLGVLLILWLFVLEAAIYRITPFLVMSSAQPHDSALQHLPLTTANFLYPDFTFFCNGEPLVGFVILIFWLANFTVPLLSCLYQTQWVTNDGTPQWRWTTVQGVGWTLLVLYILLVGALICCIVRFRRRRSALMWDPASLADLIPLFRRCNILIDYERSEVSSSMRTEIPSKPLRLGYWTTSNSQEIFHGIGEENAPIRKLSLHTSPRLAEKRHHGDSSDSFDMERQRYSYASSFTRNIHSPFVRYRWAPWFLRDSSVLAWIVVAFVLLIAFLVVSFVNNAVQHGFAPLLGSGTGSGGFSSSNFLYSFVPSLLGMILFLAWQPIDTFFRAIQPFANLSSTTGALPEHSILLDYPSQLPLLVTLRATVNGDLKVAWISFVGMLSIALPVIAGGIFTAQYFSAQNQVRIAASMPAYYALCVFATIYAASFLTVWPKRKRYLPHSIRTVADLLSFLYMSPLLADPAFTNVCTKADLVSRLVFQPRGVEMEGKSPSAKYAFGIYIGRDGKEHLGIDRLQRPDSGEMLITTGMMR